MFERPLRGHEYTLNLQLEKYTWNKETKISWKRWWYAQSLKLHALSWPSLSIPSIAWLDQSNCVKIHQFLPQSLLSWTKWFLAWVPIVTAIYHMKPLSAPNVIETVGVIEVKLLAMESFLFYHRWWVTEYMQKKQNKRKTYLILQGKWRKVI